MMIIGILPTIDGEHLNAGALQRQPALRAAQRADLRGPRGGPRDRHPRASSGCRPTPTRSPRRRPAPASSCTARSSPTPSPRTGTPRRRSPACRWPSAANSPFFFGKELWRETRIALFEQATDTRPDELKAQGVRPRVWFGERWITSIFDLFEENVRYFPALLPVCEDEDPVETLDARRHPGASRAAPAQRDDLPLEPPDLRRRARAPAPARREPHPARRPDGGRHPRQRRLLLRPGARPDRGGAAAVDADVLLGGRGELPRRARATASTRASTGPGWARSRWPSSCCAGCCPRRTRVSTAWASTPPSAIDCSASSSAAASRSATAPHGRPPSSTSLYDERGLERDAALREMTLRYRELMHANAPVHAWPLE